MALATMTLEVIGIRTPMNETDKEKKAKTVQVELRPLQNADEAIPFPPFAGPGISQTIEVDRKEQPELGARVTVTYEVAP